MPAPHPVPSAFCALRNWARSIDAHLYTYRRYYPLATALALFGILALGSALRLDDLGDWRRFESRAFFNNQPLHTTFDAWFYLSLARDLLDSTYAPLDERRGVPDSPPRPSPPPLISVIAAFAARVTPFSLCWIGALIPVLFGPLIALPTYLLGRFYGGTVTGLFAAFCSVSYPFFIYRSNIGRFDTDCLNVTFALCVTYLCLRFAIENSLKRYVYIICAAIVSGLFLWWWDQTPAAVAAIVGTPFGIALFFFYRPPRREALIFAFIVALAVASVLLFTGVHAPAAVARDIWEHFLYISKDDTSLFPNIGLTISEQSRASLDMVVGYTTGNAAVFFGALAGFMLLLYRNLKHGLFLLIFMVLSIFTVTYANRFMIFMIPLVALGSGYMLFFLWNMRHRFFPLYGLCPLLVLLVLVLMYTQSRAYTQWPKESGPAVAGMNVARIQTPPDAVIWAWWDHGYALNYYAHRATVNDGSIHSGERTVYTAIPLATASDQLAANFICFYVARGMKGIREFYRSSGSGPAHGLNTMKDILAAGPAQARTIIDAANLLPTNTCKTTEDWLDFFYPTPPRPVYLFLDNLLTKITYWWFWFGTWDIANQDGYHPFYMPFYNVRLQDNQITGSNGLQIDVTTGEAFFENNKVSLSEIGISQRGSMQRYDFGNNGRYRFEMAANSRYGALMDSSIAESVFNKLYLRLAYSERYFRLIDMRMPHYQLWQVRGDTYERQG